MIDRKNPRAADAARASSRWALSPTAGRPRNRAVPRHCIRDGCAHVEKARLKVFARNRLDACGAVF